MSFLSRLFGRKQASAAQPEVIQPECPHVALVPHWDSAGDMGKADNVTSYSCEACKGTFPREEGDRLMAEETARLHIAEEEQTAGQ